MKTSLLYSHIHKLRKDYKINLMTQLLINYISIITTLNNILQCLITDSYKKISNYYDYI